MRTRMFTRAWQRLKREAWVTFGLLLAAFLLLGLGMTRNITGLLYDDLWLPILSGLILGWGLGASSSPGLVAILSGLTIGPALVFIQVGNLAPRLVTASGLFVRTAWRSVTAGVTPSWSVAIGEWQELASDSSALIARLIAWLRGLITDTPVVDPVVTTMVWLFLLGACAMWAGWAIRRRNQPVIALLPALALLAIIITSTNGSALALAPILGLTLYLEAITSHEQQERAWLQKNISFPAQSSAIVRWTAAGLALILMTLALLTPSLSIHSVVDYARMLGEGERSQDLAQSMGLESKPDTSPVDTFLYARRPGLPASHLIGSGLELSNQPVMAITIEQPKMLAGQLRYWRGASYDRYTGRGWETGGTTTVSYDAGDQAGRKLQQQWLIRQEVKPLTDLGSLLFVAGTLRSVDQPFQAAWRARYLGTDTYLDLFAAALNRDSIASYRADSLLSLPDENALRSADQRYPERITRNYLALPEEVPDRVRALAQDLTATEISPYDRVRAIERYLRQIPYTLDLPVPPVGRDIVDYFLFELQQGYCDYYATAMVVLARAAGIPARMATGYVGGDYDPEFRRYTVTADLAHSWPEIYFPGYGWIPFEPTAGRAEIDRHDAAPINLKPDPGNDLEPIVAARQRARWNRVWRISGVAFLSIFGVLVGWWALEIWRLKLKEPKAAVISIFSQMRRSGRQLDLGVDPGITPSEYASLLKDRLFTPGNEKDKRSTQSNALDSIDWLTGLYNRSFYSPFEPGETQRDQAIKGWMRLRLKILRAIVLAMGHRALTWLRISR